MRTNEFTGVYHMVDEISPEAFKAQRMAELQNLAEFRARHLNAIKEWSVEDKRLERIAQHKVEEAVARTLFKPEAAYKPGLRLKLEDMVTITPITKPAPKRSWWQRLWSRE